MLNIWHIIHCIYVKLLPQNTRSSQGQLLGEMQHCEIQNYQNVLNNIIQFCDGNTKILNKGELYLKADHLISLSNDSNGHFKNTVRSSMKDKAI